MRKLRLGVIGAGGRGTLARRAHRPEEGSFLVAAADTREEPLARFREMYGPEVMVTKDYRELLARPDIDAVFVTTPDYLHEEHALAAIAAGKGVYLEKPMAITIEGCDRILSAAVKANVKLYLGHNMRHFPVMRKMKDLIDGGAIGQVKSGWCRHFVAYGGDAYFKDWHADRRCSTSLLLQKGAHDIDILHWLCGGYTQRVTAMGNLSVYNTITDRHSPDERGDASWSHDNWPPLSLKQLNPVIDVEDLSLMLMELDNGVLCSYEQCHYTPDGWRNYTIIGTEGRIENFGDVPGESTVVKLWNRRAHYKPQGDQEFRFPKEAAGSHGGADPLIVGEFLRYLREGGRTRTSPLAARYAVAAGCLAAQSMRSGNGPMPVPPPPREAIEKYAPERA
jgi:predicted dehydrogenase